MYSYCRADWVPYTRIHVYMPYPCQGNSYSNCINRERRGRCSGIIMCMIPTRQYIIIPHNTRHTDSHIIWMVVTLSSVFQVLLTINRFWWTNSFYRNDKDRWSNTRVNTVATKHGDRILNTHINTKSTRKRNNNSVRVTKNGSMGHDHDDGGGRGREGRGDGNQSEPPKQKNRQSRGNRSGMETDMNMTIYTSSSSLAYQSPIHYYYFFVRTNTIKYNNQQQQKREKERDEEVVMVFPLAWFPLDNALFIAPVIHIIIQHTNANHCYRLSYLLAQSYINIYYDKATEVQ